MDLQLMRGLVMLGGSIWTHRDDLKEALAEVETLKQLDRRTFARLCAEAGLPDTDAGYWRWREICARVEGVQDHDVMMRALNEAFASMVTTANETAAAFESLNRSLDGLGMKKNAGTFWERTKRRVSRVRQQAQTWRRRKWTT